MADKTPPAAEVENELDYILDRETLNGEMHYRFIQSRPQRISRMLSKGYRIVKVSGHGVKPLAEDMIGPDDTIRDGDTVLMFVPREKHLAGRRKLADLNRARMATPKAEFRKKTRGAAPDGSDIRIVTADKSDCLLYTSPSPRD